LAPARPALGVYHPTVAELFERLSTVLAVPTESELLALQAGTALMGPFYQLQVLLQVA
jgi:hypothetical protein